MMSPREMFYVKTVSYSVIGEVSNNSIQKDRISTSILSKNGWWSPPASAMMSSSMIHWKINLLKTLSKYLYFCQMRKTSK